MILSLIGPKACEPALLFGKCYCSFFDYLTNLSELYIVVLCFRFRYGRLQTVGLTLPDQYELVDNLVAYNRPWKTLPLEDIKVNRNNNSPINEDNSDAILGMVCSASHSSHVGYDLTVVYNDTNRP